MFSPSFSLTPSSKYSNIVIYGLEDSGKSSLYKKWVGYCFEKKRKTFEATSTSSNKSDRHNDDNKSPSPQGFSNPKLSKKQEKELFEKVLKELNDESHDDDDDEESENFKIGPRSEPCTAATEKISAIGKSNTNPHSSLVEVAQCHSNQVGSNTKCVLFDLPCSSNSVTTWKSVYQRDIDCLFYVVDVSPASLSDASKMKQSAATMWKFIEELKETSWKHSEGSVVLIANKLDLLFPPTSNDNNNISGGDAVENLRQTILTTDGPVGSVFNVAELRRRFCNFDFLGTSAETGEGIYNVLLFVSQYIVYPKNEMEHRKREMNKARQK